MDTIAQMYPGMQFIPLIMFAVGALTVVVVVWVTYTLLVKIFPARRFGGGTIALLLILSLAIVGLMLPTPVAESRVIEAAEQGIPVSDLISIIGEPHEQYLDADGSGTLHYYADYFGHTGIGVIVRSDGTVGGTWVD